MPSPILLLPFIQSITDRRKPEPETYADSGRAERGQQQPENNNLSGELRPEARWGLVREKIQRGSLVKELEEERRRRRTRWRRVKDYLWGQETEESRGEYIPNYRCVKNIPNVDLSSKSSG